MQKELFEITSVGLGVKGVRREATQNSPPQDRTVSAGVVQKEARRSGERPRLVPVGYDYAIVDNRDYKRVIEHHWYRSHRYAMATVNGVQLHMHRFIMGNEDGVHYDHKNGFGLDNRRSNLRPATQAENTRNTYKGRFIVPASSKYKGVSWRPDRQRWQAYIGTRGSGIGRQHLGCYETQELAAEAYNKAAIIRFGEFAKLNVIE